MNVDPPSGNAGRRDWFARSFEEWFESWKERFDSLSILRTAGSSAAVLFRKRQHCLQSSSPMGFFSWSGMDLFIAMRSSLSLHRGFVHLPKYFGIGAANVIRIEREAIGRISLKKLTVRQERQALRKRW